MDETLDRISNLPDDVLAHILSFVSAKEGVQTCILSKGWRNVWASMPVLKFSFDDFWEHVPDDGINDVSDDDINDAFLKFDRFVNSMFVKRGQLCIETLMYDADFESSSVEPSMEWLHRATLLSPKVIDVDTNGPDGLQFPNSVFSCASLRELKLSVFSGASHTIIKPKSITLPCLKTLELNLTTVHDRFARNLILGCPSLESLNLEDCYLYVSKISSNVLKKLTLWECWHCKRMEICCPSLVSLVIRSSHNSIRIISLVNMASLVNADINLNGLNGIDDQEADIDDLSKLSVLWTFKCYQFEATI